MPRDIEKRIVEVLKNHPEGLTIKQIAQKVGLHRLNITKYIYALTASGMIYQRKVGPAKLCYLKKVGR